MSIKVEELYRILTRYQHNVDYKVWEEIRGVAQVWQLKYRATVYVLFYRTHDKLLYYVVYSLLKPSL